MSIIKKPYTISVWDDVWKGEKFVEKRLGIIGSDKMESQCRAIEPNLTCNTNGTKKLTFKLYKRYKDNITGELVENPFYDWLVNERKVKLEYDGKWYDFIIKNIQENSSNYLYTYQLEDAIVQELTKNGFNIELNDSLMNNSGTVNELAKSILKETNWSVSNKSESFVEAVEEALVWLQVNEEFEATQIFDQQEDNLSNGVSMNPEKVKIPKDARILAFYSSCANKPYRFQFIYVDGAPNTLTKDENRIITNKDCQYYIDIPTYPENSEEDYGFYLPSFLNITTVIEVPKTNFVTVSSEYRARRYGFTQKTIFVPLLNRYVNIYSGPEYNLEKPDEEGNATSDIYYGYLNTEYKSPVLVQNVISNTQFKSDSGWTGIEIGRINNGTYTEVYPAGLAENITGRINENTNTIINIEEDFSKSSNFTQNTYSTYMKLSLNGGAAVLNSGPYDNRVYIGNMEPDEEWAIVYKTFGNSKLSFSLGEYIYSSSNNAYLLDTNNIKFESKTLTEKDLKVNYLFRVTKNKYSKEAFKKNCQVRLLIHGSGTHYIESISLFKVVRNDEGYIILPEDQVEDVNNHVIDTTYYLFKPEKLSTITSDEQLIPDTTLKKIDYSQFLPVMNEGAQKVRTISAKESNYFNILQNIAETFEAWLDFDIERDKETGAIISKKILFRNYIGKDNPVGFKYGINLKDIQRTFESKQIVTKLIVKNNSNEFADNGFCSIARAGANPTGENYIYDFQYFFNRGLLKARDYLDTLYAYDMIDPNNPSNRIYAQGKDINEEDTEYNIIGYFPRIKALNRKIDGVNAILLNLSKDIVKLKADYEIADAGLEAAIGGIEQCEIDFKKAIATSQDVSIKTANIGQYSDRTDVQKILREYALFVIEEARYAEEKLNIETNLYGKIKENGELQEGLQQQYDKLTKEIEGYKDSKIELNKLFFQLYSRFIQEGTWIDESYVDDEKYYADAQSVLYNSCYPNAAYTVNVIEISKLPGYEDFVYDLGDKTNIEDKDFFGSNKPVEVVVTETTEDLDDPIKNKIKVQTFKNQFQDLFQKITATVQQAQYSTGSYEKAVALAEAGQERKNQFVTDALAAAEARLQVAGQQSVEIGDDGITITDVDTPSDKIRMVGGAILLSKQDKNGQTKWVTGVTSDGVSASLVTAGVLNAGEITIMNYDQPLFRWDSFGLTAFDAKWAAAEGGQYVVSGLKTDRFVRFDKYGLYGINGAGVDGTNWHPSSIEVINDKATFALTWDGLKVTGNKATVFIGKHADKNNNKVLFSVNDNDNDNSTFSIASDGTVTIGGFMNNSASGNYSWNFSVDDGLFMYQGIQSAENCLFKIASGGLFINGNGEFTGKITANDGHIGGEKGWQITEGAIRQGGNNNTIYLGVPKSLGGKNSIVFKAGSNFLVDEDGILYANGGNFSGTITGSTIKIGGTPGTPKFQVDTSGDVILDGNITWGTTSNPVKVVYNKNYAEPPANNTSYNQFEEDYDPINNGWHKTFDSKEDKYASYTYNDGKTWGNAVKIVGEDGKVDDLTRDSIYKALDELGTKSQDGIYRIGEKEDRSGIIGINATAIKTGVLEFKTGKSGTYFISPFAALKAEEGEGEQASYYIRLPGLSIDNNLKATFTGKIYANEGGELAGWKIDANTLYKEDENFYFKLRSFVNNSFDGLIDIGVKSVTSNEDSYKPLFKIDRNGNGYFAGQLECSNDSGNGWIITPGSIDGGEGFIRIMRNGLEQFPIQDGWYESNDPSNMIFQIGQIDVQLSDSKTTTSNKEVKDSNGKYIPEGQSSGTYQPIPGYSYSRTFTFTELGLAKGRTYTRLVFSTATIGFSNNSTNTATTTTQTKPCKIDNKNYTVTYYFSPTSMMSGLDLTSGRYWKLTFEAYYKSTNGIKGKAPALAILEKGDVYCRDIKASRRVDTRYLKIWHETEGAEKTIESHDYGIFINEENNTYKDSYIFIGKFGLFRNDLKTHPAGMFFGISTNTTDRTSFTQGPGLRITENLDSELSGKSVYIKSDDSNTIFIQNGNNGGNVKIGYFDSTNYLYGTWRIQQASNSSASNVTSDENVKNTISNISIQYETIFDELQAKTFKYNYGTSDRTHIGFIAQQVYQSVLKAGLDSKDFAPVCYETNENGEKVEWGIRYEEIVALNTWQIQKLKSRTLIAEEEIARLKLEIQQLHTELSQLKN